MTTEPCGVLAIVTDKDGRVIASEGDFGTSAPGGFKLWQAQIYRASQSARRSAITAYCSTVLSGALTSHLVERIFAELEQRAGHRITYRAIGWGSDIQDEINARCQS